VDSEVSMRADVEMWGVWDERTKRGLEQRTRVSRDQGPGTPCCHGPATPWTRLDVDTEALEKTPE
jgi:hypothetical protein